MAAPARASERTEGETLEEVVAADVSVVTEATGPTPALAAQRNPRATTPVADEPTPEPAPEPPPEPQPEPAPEPTPVPDPPVEVTPTPVAVDPVPVPDPTTPPDVAPETPPPDTSATDEAPTEDGDPEAAAAEEPEPEATPAPAPARKESAAAASATPARVVQPAAVPPPAPVVVPEVVPPPAAEAIDYVEVSVASPRKASAPPSTPVAKSTVTLVQNASGPGVDPKDEYAARVLAGTLLPARAVGVWSTLGAAAARFGPWLMLLVIAQVVQGVARSALAEKLRTRRA